MMKILIVEDDKTVNEVLANFLIHDGYEVACAFDGKTAVELFDGSVHLVVLDIMLPDTNGIELLKAFRKKSKVPIIMLTAVDDEFTQLASFQNQADEYVCKPFSPAVMTKRINALIGRLYGTLNNKEEIVTIMGFDFDFGRYTVTHGQDAVPFTTKEMELIKVLYKNQGKTVSRQYLLDSVWGYDSVLIDRTVDTHVKNIRKKLCDEIILTVKNVGYRLNL